MYLGIMFSYLHRVSTGAPGYWTNITQYKKSILNNMCVEYTYITSYYSDYGRIFCKFANELV